MSKLIQCKCCKKYTWEMDVHSSSGLCHNCYDYVADLEGHIKGLTKVRNYEKCKHIRKRKRLQQQIADLEAKLTEQNKEINKLKGLVKTIDSYNQYSDKAENFIILDPKNCYLDGHKLIIKTDKIDYAVEQLEIVKSTILDYVDIEITRLKDIDEIFDNQIKQIKEGK